MGNCIKNDVRIEQNVNRLKSMDGQKPHLTLMQFILDCKTGNKRGESGALPKLYQPHANTFTYAIPVLCQLKI